MSRAARLPCCAIACAALLVGVAGCTEDGARVLPFAQPKFELRVGETVDIVVALSQAPDKALFVDISSEFDGVDLLPKVLEYGPKKRVGTVQITGRKTSRGVFQPVRFDLRDTQTGNTLLILVANSIDPTDAGVGDGQPTDGPAADGPAGDTSKPDATKPDAAQPDATQPDATQPDATQPDAAQTDAAQTDGGTDA